MSRSVLRAPLAGLVLMLGCVPARGPGVAVYAINRSTFDLLLATGFGVIGWALRKLGIPLAPVILGLVLGPLMEKNLRRSLALSDGDWTVLFSSPLAVAFWVLAGVALLRRHLVPRSWRRRAEVSSSAASRGRD